VQIILEDNPVGSRSHWEFIPVCESIKRAHSYKEVVAPASPIHQRQRSRSLTPLDASNCTSTAVEALGMNRLLFQQALSESHRRRRRTGSDRQSFETPDSPITPEPCPCRAWWKLTGNRGQFIHQRKMALWQRTRALPSGMYYIVNVSSGRRLVRQNGHLCLEGFGNSSSARDDNAKFEVDSHILLDTDAAYAFRAGWMECS
jgi:hypothetical protein